MGIRKLDAASLSVDDQPLVGICGEGCHKTCQRLFKFQRHNTALIHAALAPDSGNSPVFQFLADEIRRDLIGINRNILGSAAPKLR